MDSAALAASPHVRYVALGEFGDECEAIKAYLTTTHEVRMRRDAAGAERGDASDLALRSGGGPE